LTQTNQNLSNRLARADKLPKLPAPPSAAALPLESLVRSNLYSLLTNKDLKLSPQQLERYLLAHHRDAASLLAAFRTTHAPELLTEAIQRFPDDPQVEFEAALRKDAPPGESRLWLDLLAKNAPNNALANYLSAADYFKAGQTDRAVQELVAASGKPEFKDYALERAQEDEEAFRAAGYSVPESKLAANMQLALPQMGAFAELSASLLDVAKAYGQAGDQASRQAILDMGASLGRRYSEGGPGESLVSQLLGVAIERNSLAAMDPQSAFNGTTQTVQQRLDELNQHRANIRALNQQAEPLWRTLSDPDYVSYQSRTLAFGEEAALQWLVNQNAQP
jgi:hypothetical protein